MTVIESLGSTDLDQIGNNYFLYDDGTTTGPELKRGGTAVVAGQLAGWTPIGAEKTSSGYDVAFKLTGANLYTVWSTDSSGNYITNIIGAVSGTDSGLETLETTFSQDLNGDGVTGLVTTVIETKGATDLDQVGNNYFLYDDGTTTGPELKRGGTAVVAGQLAGWTPIGAEKTSSGYDVAFKLTGANLYTVWSTDSSGNYITNIIGAVSGTDSGLETLETTFSQDLNGDGVTGVNLVTTVIETKGATDLDQVGNNYFLYDDGTTTGPELKRGGTAVVAGQLAGWTPIGAEKTSTGYDVAFKLTGANLYTVWSTDSSGNYTANIIGAVPGTDSGLETLETTFSQDLNGDGVTGINLVTTVIETKGATDLDQVGNNYFLYDDGTTTGPELKRGGAAVVAGQLAGWTPIGAEKTSTGYDVAFKLTGANLYTVWSTDSSGNYTANIIGAVPGTDSGLETLETTFSQDLNGDGVTGVNLVTTVIETKGATDLDQVGNNYFLYDDGTTTGPELKRGGAAVVAGQLAGWTPIGAEKTSTGYDVAFKLTGANLYTVWSTDSSGNYTANIIGAVPGTDSGLETLETTFSQDLNGDGVTGVNLVTTVIETKGATDLDQVGNNYFLYDDGTTTGPELKRGGAAVVAGQLAGWTPIGAEKTSSGYDVAFKLTGADLYTVWSTDSTGNYTANLIGAVPGTDSGLETLETTFSQDLNGDGVTGINLVTTVIETKGATDLDQVGNNYFLYDDGTTTGPELKRGGTAVVAGQLAGWTPIGAEKTSSGYDVALKLTGADLYTVWSTDSSGNYTANLIGAVPGTSSALEVLENTFSQDLNGDGVTGVSIGAGEAREIASAYSGDVTFTGSSGVLKLDHSSSFSGTVAGMSGQDTIDFADIKFANVQTPSYSGTSSGGTLTVTDGTHSGNIALLGNYLTSTFVASNDGHGGTAVVDPILGSSAPQTTLTQPQHV